MARTAIQGLAREQELAGHAKLAPLVVGFHRGKDLIYAVRCPFFNLPEPAAGRWGQGLTAEKMKECVWVRPDLVAQIHFLDWTGADYLRHAKFVGLKDDKDPSKVVRET